MSAPGQAWWFGALWCGLGLAVALGSAVVIARRRRAHAQAVTAGGAAPTVTRPVAPSTGEDQAPPIRMAEEGSTVPDVTVRFEVDVVLTEMTERYLIVDALAEVVDGRGLVFGVPVSLILARPASRLGEERLLNLMDEAGDKRCQVEVDLTEGRSSVKLLPPGRHLPIPVQAASGLPSPF